jgi:hypothetical protein
MEETVIVVPRWVVAAIAALFALYPVFLAVMSLRESYLIESVFAIFLYLSAIVPSVVAYRSFSIPPIQAIYNFAVSVSIPALLLPKISPTSVGSYSTWFVGAIASIMAVTAFRRFGLFATAATIIVIVEIIRWGGVDRIASVGVFGAVMFLAAGILVSRGLARISEQTEDYEAAAVQTAALSAASTAARLERKHRTGAALLQALPTLQEIASSSGMLSLEQKTRARTLESELRDGIRGDALINPAMKAAVSKARAAGAEVVLLDDGGLEDVLPADRERILAEVAAAIESVQSERITVRAAKQESYLVSVMATRFGEPKPDLWLRLK